VVYISGIAHLPQLLYCLPWYHDIYKRAACVFLSITYFMPAKDGRKDVVLVCREEGGRWAKRGAGPSSGHPDAAAATRALGARAAALGTQVGFSSLEFGPLMSHHVWS